jgi:8-hydroxy-5-deazaflavin:NADPH oxidoreductase
MTPPTVAVLGGTGHQGRGIALRLSRAGYPVIIGSRDRHRASAIVSEWPSTTRAIATADYRGAAADAEIAVLAVPFDALDALLGDVSASLRAGMLVVDVTVPITFSAAGPSLTAVAEGSAAEHVKARLPAHVRVAAAFKTIPAHLLNALDARAECDEFVCGDSPEARTAASQLTGAVDGLRPIDVGPLSRARAIEHLTLLAIAINRKHKIHDARFRVVGL